MNISKYGKAAVLAALYNNSKPQGMGFLHAEANDMTHEEATKILLEKASYGYGLYFDYLKGRVLKIDLSTDELNTSLYNRDLGEGAAERIISELPELPVQFGVNS